MREILFELIGAVPTLRLQIILNQFDINLLDNYGSLRNQEDIVNDIMNLPLD